MDWKYGTSSQIPLNLSSLYYITITRYNLSQARKKAHQAKKGIKGKMVLLDHLWDDVVAGPQPERGLKHLKKVFTAKPLNIKEVGGEGSGSGSSKYARSVSMPPSPVTPTTPSPSGRSKDTNVWRSVFHPGSNLATKKIGADYFDRPQPNSPTVYDWLYSGDTRSKHR